MNETQRSPLRFGIMSRGAVVSAWQAAALRELVASGHAVPSLLITDITPRARSGRRTNLLWRAYSRLSPPRALADVNVSSELEAVPELRCAVTRKGRFSEYFSEEDLATIRGYDLDFILRFGFGIVRGGILRAARHGVWSFHHGDELRYRGGPPGFWEIYRGDPVNGAILQRLTEKLDGGVVLRKGFLKTTNYSYARNVDRLFFETAHWPAYVAREIRHGITAHVDAEPSTTQAPVYKLPTGAQALRFFGIVARNALAYAFQRRRDEEWNIGVAKLRVEEVLAGRTVSDVRWLPPVDGGWAADPMAMAIDGRVHVLCERMSLDARKASIAATSFNGGGWTALSPAIDTGTHASYPYVFELDGEVYCVPETFEAREVRLYRAIAFPQRWERVGTLIQDFPAVDSTIFRHDGRFWLFCTSQESSGTTLYAFYADALLGPWRPHLRNPVKIDIRGSRPAGAPFLYGGALYRPAQDSSRTYGGRVAINRVLELSPQAFREETRAYVEPDPSSEFREGLHTLSFAGDYCVIDGKRWRRRR